MSAALPETMNAIEIAEHGGPESLKLGQRPVPEAGPGEVLIKVAAAGINRADCLQRKGVYPPPEGASDIPGLEAAGTVVALGAGVSGFEPGQPVCALLTGGGYAEYCAIPAAVVLPLPDGLDLTQAGGIPETFFTVWANVYMRAAFKPGETLLVHGGASGIGTTAIQLATALGSEVFVTAGTAEKCVACERLGAARAINYRDEDFVVAIRDVTGGRGVDVILDMVAGHYVPRNLKVLAPEGRLVHIATQSGHEVEVNLATLMAKGLTITGSRLRPQPVGVKAKIAAELSQKVWPLLASGRVKPVIDSTFALADAAGAHAKMEADTHIGKIVLVV